MRELLAKMGERPRALLRTKEAAYRALGLADANLSDDVLLDAMVKHPELVQRPIVERGARAVLARPVARVRVLL